MSRLIPCLWKNDSCDDEDVSEVCFWLSLMQTPVRPVCVKVEKVCALEWAELSPPGPGVTAVSRRLTFLTQERKKLWTLRRFNPDQVKHSCLSDVRAPPSCWWRVCKPASPRHHFYPPCFYYHDFLINLSLLFLISDLLLTPINPSCISSPLIT